MDAFVSQFPHGPADPGTEDSFSKTLRSVNAGRDYTIYAGGMDLGAPNKASKLFSDLCVAEGGVIVDAGSGTGVVAAIAAEQYFPHAKVYAQDLSHELLTIADSDRPLIIPVYGSVLKQCFPDASVDVKYFSSIVHELETFGGPGSAKLAFMVARNEAKPLGEVRIRDFIRPARTEPIYMEILTDSDGLDALPHGVSKSDLNYSLLSTRLLLELFQQDFLGGNAFTYETVEIGGKRLYRIDPQWAYEFALHKDYTANWRQECNERYGHFTQDEWRALLESAGYENVRVIPEHHEYTMQRVRSKLAFYDIGDNGELKELNLGPTHVAVRARKPAEITAVHTVPAFDYAQLLSEVRIDEQQQVICIGPKRVVIEGAVMYGARQACARLRGEPDKVIKVPRADMPNPHSAFMSMSQIVDRTEVIEEYETPCMKVLEFDREGPPYQYLIQEALPKDAVRASDLIRTGEIREEDIRQMAEIVSGYERKKTWQVSTNPDLWYRLTKPDGSTQMTYASGKVYQYDQAWEFRRIGLLQWIDPKYCADETRMAPELPSRKDYEVLCRGWQSDSRQLAQWWRKYLAVSASPGEA